MSRTGNNRGFSLLEVLVATVILSTAAVLLFPSFFMASDALGIARDQLVAQPWADNKLWEDSRVLEQAGAGAVGSERGEVLLGKRLYVWERRCDEVEPGLQALTLTLRWTAAGKEHEKAYVAWAPAPQRGTL